MTDPFPLILYFEGWGRGKGVAVVDNVAQLLDAMKIPIPLAEVFRLDDDTAVFIKAMQQAVAGDTVPAVIPENFGPDD